MLDFNKGNINRQIVNIINNHNNQMPEDIIDLEEVSVTYNYDDVEIKVPGILYDIELMKALNLLNCDLVFEMSCRGRLTFKLVDLNTGNSKTGTALYIPYKESYIESMNLFINFNSLK